MTSINRRVELRVMLAGSVRFEDIERGSKGGIWRWVFADLCARRLSIGRQVVCSFKFGVNMVGVVSGSNT